MIDCIDHSYKIKEGTTENIWCVFDRDFEDVDFSRIKDTDNINFTSSIQAAKSAGLQVAWSNDSFELWVLLHFEKVPSLEKLHRNYLYDRLTDIFKTLKPVAKEFAEIINRPMFSYKTSLKKRAAFLTHVLPLLKSRTQIAIDNAIELESKFDGSVLYHNCNPCTKVHHLVQQLLKV